MDQVRGVACNGQVCACKVLRALPFWGCGEGAGSRGMADRWGLEVQVWGIENFQVSAFMPSPTSPPCSFKTVSKGPLPTSQPNSWSMKNLHRLLQEACLLVVHRLTSTHTRVYWSQSSARPGFRREEKTGSLDPNRLDKTAGLAPRPVPDQAPRF